MNRRWLLLTLVATTIIAGGLFWRQQHAASRRLAAWNDHLQDEVLSTALNKPIELPRGRIPLPDFARQLSKATGFDVVIDDDVELFKPSLDPFNIPDPDSNPPRSPYVPNIDIGYSKLPASSHLSLALQQLDLCWFIRRGQIVIATPEVAENQPLLVVTHSIPQCGAVEQPADSDTWSHLVTTIIARHHWTDVGGRGHCEAVPGALVIAQTPDIQRQIRALLDTLEAQDDLPRSWKPLLIWPPANPRHAAITAALAQPTSIDCHDIPLEVLVDSLATRHDIPIVLNRKRLGEASVGRDSPVTLTLSDISLGSLLNHILRELELTWLIRDGVLEITTPEDAESQLILVAYPVHDLAAVPFNPQDPRSRDMDSIIELICATIRPDSWDDVGGPASIDSIGGWLLIPQTQSIHEDIERLLGGLRRHLALGDTPTLFAQPNNPLAEARILAALEQPLTLSYADMPLNRVCDGIGQRLKVPIHLPLKELADGSVKPDLSVTCDYAPAPARLQLQRLLHQHELTYSIRDEVLHVTTPEDAESWLATHLYDVRSLIEPSLSLFDSQDNDDSLADLIENHVKPDSWDAVGGPCANDVFRGLLVVSQTPQGHHSLAAFLEELRRATRWRNNSAVMPSTPPSGDEQRVLSALKSEIALDFDQIPLTEVCRDLSRQLGIPIRWDPRLLPLSGLYPDPAVTFHAPRALAHDQLRRITTAHELGLDIRAGVLTFYGSDKIHTLQTRIYDARSLMHDMPPHPAHATSPKKLLESITARIQPDTWQQRGGPARIDSLQGFLIVSQSWQNHAELESLLSEHRAAVPASSP